MIFGVVLLASRKGVEFQIRLCHYRIAISFILLRKEKFTYALIPRDVYQVTLTSGLVQMQLIGRSILEVVDSNLDESTDYCDLGF
jgi:hypothetical protein